MGQVTLYQLMPKNQETIFVEAGEKIELFKRRFSSVPMTYQFMAKSTCAKPLAGLVEIHSQQMLFSGAENIMNLKQTNEVKASLWDTFMTIYVIAGCDMEITLSKHSKTTDKSLLGLVVILVLIASMVMLFFIQNH